MTEQDAAILSATRGAKRGWQNLATVALRAAVRWKRERDELEAELAAANSEPGKVECPIDTCAYAFKGDNRSLRLIEHCTSIHPALLGGSESGGN